MSSELPKPPTKPPPPEEKRGSWLSIGLALVLCLGIFVVISFLTLGTFLPVLAIAGIILAFAGFHYCVWGWWLGRVLRDAEEEEATEDS